MATIPKSPSKSPSWLQELSSDIDRFWFAYGSATTLGVFRILLGFANLANLLLILPFFDAWYTERGFTPLAVTDQANLPIARDFLFFNHVMNLPFTVPRINVLSDVTNSSLFLAFYIAVILAAVLTTIGLWTRISSIALAVGIVTLQHRNILILHGGDSVVRLGALYIALAPSGRTCSLDRLIGLWKERIKPGPVLVSLWPQRLIAFNLALIYFTTWWVKMDGERWRNGTATWFPSHLNEFQRFWVPPFLQSRWMTPFATYGTLATELALGTIVFWRPARRWVLLAGIFMHGYIEYSMNIPLFALSICSWYVVFYEGEEVSAWARRLGDKFGRFRLLVHVPRANSLEAGPALAIKAMDPLGLVTYEQDESASLTVEKLGRPVAKPVRAIWTRSAGAWILGLIPGLWRRVLLRAFPAGAEA